MVYIAETGLGLDVGSKESFGRIWTPILPKGPKAWGPQVCKHVPSLGTPGVGLSYVAFHTSTHTYLAILCLSGDFATLSRHNLGLDKLFFVIRHKNIFLEVKGPGLRLQPLLLRLSQEGGCGPKCSHLCIRHD